MGRRRVGIERGVSYAGLEMGLVDAVVMAIAERLKAHEIATLDRRWLLPNPQALELGSGGAVK